MILARHDWDSELVFIQSFLQSEFGNLWKEKASEYMSWRGLEKIDEFVNWAFDNNISSNEDVNGNITYPDFNGLVTMLRSQGKRDCL